MSDEMAGVLQELSSLLRRLTEQNGASARRADEDLLSRKTQLEENGARSGKFRPDMGRKELLDFSLRMSQVREEESKFKQQLLEEIKKHNRLLETLILKMGRLS